VINVCVVRAVARNFCN